MDASSLAVISSQISQRGRRGEGPGETGALQLPVADLVRAARQEVGAQADGLRRLDDTVGGLARSWSRLSPMSSAA